MQHPSRILPAEWHPQAAILLTWPHEHSDWETRLAAAEACFYKLAQAIIDHQALWIICPDADAFRQRYPQLNKAQLQLFQIPSNDTWARDHAALSVLENDQAILLDFKFNGWGLQFPADLDNGINRNLWQQGAWPQARFENHLNFVLEGGSIESDGLGTLLTTSECLLSPNRNGAYSQAEIERYLGEALGAKRVLWLENGYLAGDDTGSHIDTLARFCNPSTIAYVQCLDSEDEHFTSLQAMEKELQQFRQTNGEAYQLLPLPMAEAVYEDGRRLPATYANFLITNEKVLLPFYDSPRDEEARSILQSIFPQRRVEGIACQTLIQQNGSLHCVTMQFPQELVK